MVRGVLKTSVGGRGRDPFRGGGAENHPCGRGPEPSGGGGPEPSQGVWIDPPQGGD